MKKYVMEIGDKEYTAEVKEVTTDHAEVVINGETYRVNLKEIGRKKAPEIQQVKKVAPTAPSPAPKKKAAPKHEASGDAEAVRAPLPGLILNVMVNPGDRVTAGQNIVLMEAMKMENQVQAAHDGEVVKVHVNQGDSVEEEQLLVEIRRSAMSMI